MQLRTLHQAQRADGVRGVRQQVSKGEREGGWEWGLDWERGEGGGLVFVRELGEGFGDSQVALNCACADMRRRHVFGAFYAVRGVDVGLEFFLRCGCPLLSLFTILLPMVFTLLLTLLCNGCNDAVVAMLLNVFQCLSYSNGVPPFGIFVAPFSKSGTWWSSCSALASCRHARCSRSACPRASPTPTSRR